MQASYSILLLVLMKILIFSATTPRPAKPLPPLKFISKEEGVEGIIARALLVGNLQAAVECCLRSNRYADALVLAACGGPDLWSYARETYIKSQGANNPFTTLISKVVKVRSLFPY